MRRLNVDRMRRHPVAAGPRSRSFPVNEASLGAHVEWLESVARVMGQRRPHDPKELRVEAHEDAEHRNVVVSWELRSPTPATPTEPRS